MLNYARSGEARRAGPGTAVACRAATAHMEAVTHRVNMMRGNTIPAKNAAKTHCLRGHPFDEKNTRISKEGARRCRACNRGYSRQHNERVRAARSGRSEGDIPESRKAA